MLISSTTSALSTRHGSDEAAIRALSRAGFTACDLGLFDHPWHGGLFAQPDDAFDQYFLNVKSLAKLAGVDVWQTHAPMPTTTGEPQEDAHRLQIMRRAIRATAKLGSRYIVIHPALHTGCRYTEGHEEAMEVNLSLFRALAPTLEEFGVKLALENMFAWDKERGAACPTAFSTAKEMVQALTVLGRESFCACLDTGHAVLLGYSPADMIATLGDWLKILHVHDNDGKNDLHNPPYTGITDWDAVCEALRTHHYVGTLSLEADSLLSKYPTELEGVVLRLMAETANHLAYKIDIAE